MDLAEARRTGLPIAEGATIGSNDEREENVTPGPGEAPIKVGDVKPAPVRPFAVERQAPTPADTTTVLPPADLAGEDPTDSLVARIDRIILKARLRDATRINAKLDELEALFQ